MENEQIFTRGQRFFFLGYYGRKPSYGIITDIHYMNTYPNIMHSYSVLYDTERFPGDSKRDIMKHENFFCKDYSIISDDYYNKMISRTKIINT